jgi:uncharacterized membrane protein
MGAETVATILGMALVTYATRAGGFWLMGRVTPSPRLEAWLRHLPGALLAALVAPAIVAAGPAGWLAALAAGLIAARTGNVLLALGIGVAAIWALRLVL